MNEINDKSNGGNLRAFSLREPVTGMSVRDLLAPLFRRHKLFWAVLLSVFGIVILLAELIGPSYASHMSILVNRERLDPLVSTESTSQMGSGPSTDVSLEEINSEKELLLSQDILERVVVATGLGNRTPTFLDKIFPSPTSAANVEKAARQLANRLQIKNATNSNLIDVTYKSSDPKLSFAVLSALGNFYVEKHVEVHRAPGSSQFFSEQTRKYHDALQESEAKLRDFSRSQGVAAPDVQRTDLAQTVATAMGQLYTAEQAIASDEKRIQSDEEQLEKTPQRYPTLEATGPADRLLNDLSAGLLAARTKRAQLALKYEPTYPLVQEADQEIAETQAAITEAEKTKFVTQSTDADPTYELLRQDLARTQADLPAQRAGAAALKSGIETLQSQMVDLDQKALNQADLLREVKADEDNYLLYLGKREQEITSDALDKTRIGNVAIADPPAIPVLPVYSIPKVILAALGMALLLSAGLAYTVDYFDSSFHTPAQVVDIMGIPVVIAVSKKTA